MSAKQLICVFVGGDGAPVAFPADAVVLVSGDPLPGDVGCSRVFLAGIGGGAHELASVMVRGDARDVAARIWPDAVVYAAPDAKRGERP